MIIQSIRIEMGRNMEVNNKMKDIRREKILSSALKLFSTKGLTGTKISDIAKDSNSSQGLVYHYFKSKDAIFIELINSAFKKLIDACIALEKMSVPADEKIKMAIKELILGLQSKDTSRTHLLIATASVSDSIPKEAKNVIRTKNALPYQVIARIIKDGQEQGCIRKDSCSEEMATAFWSSIKGIAITNAVHGNKMKIPAPEILINMFIKNGDSYAKS